MIFSRRQRKVEGRGIGLRSSFKSHPYRLVLFSAAQGLFLGAVELIVTLCCRVDCDTVLSLEGPKKVILCEARKELTGGILSLSLS